jgi:ABC-2 type transport system ATP-binding protein
MIEIKSVQVLAGQQLVLDIAALCVAPGEIAAVAGPTGSGVETLFAVLLGRARPSAGSVRLAGCDPADKSAFSRKAGVLFSEDGLYLRQSPRANLVLHCQLFGLPPTRADEVLAQVGLGDQADAKLDRLPPGLRRRLAFGRAILHRPEVLLLADPFARCDQTTAALLARMIRDLAEAGAAVLILADDTANLDPLCDRIYAMSGGRLTETPRLDDKAAAVQSFMIPVRAEDKVILLNPGDIRFVEAQGGHATVQTATSRLATQFTLAELEARLARSGFFRAHRSYLVNLQHVREIIPYTRNSFSLRLDDAAGTEIPLSKSAAGELKELLGY